MVGLFCTTFLFIFGWQITPALDITVIVSVLASFWVFVVKRGVLYSPWLTWAALMLSATVYIILIVSLNGAYDPFWAWRMLRAILNLAGGMAIAQMFIERYGTQALEKGVSLTFWCIVLHAAIMTLMYINESFRSLILGITHATNYVNNPLSLELGLRIPGLTYGLGTTSVLQAFGLFLLAPLLKTSRSLPRLILLVSAACVIVISIGLSGRTGLVVGGMLLTAILWLYLPIVRAGSLARFNFVILLLGITVTVAALQFVAQLEAKLGNISFTLQHVSEVLDLLEQGHSQTTGILANMVFLPKDFSDLLFGTSNSGRGSGVYIPSDIGFILEAFAIGIIGTALTLLAFLYPVGASIRRMRLNDLVAVAIIAIFIAVIIMHMKQVALFTRQLWSVQALLGSLLLWNLGLTSKPAVTSATGAWRTDQD